MNLIGLFLILATILLLIGSEIRCRLFIRENQQILHSLRLILLSFSIGILILSFLPQSIPGENFFLKMPDFNNIPFASLVVFSTCLVLLFIRVLGSLFKFKISFILSLFIAFNTSYLFFQLLNSRSGFSIQFGGIHPLYITLGVILITTVFFLANRKNLSQEVIESLPSKLIYLEMALVFFAFFLVHYFLIFNHQSLWFSLIISFVASLGYGIANILFFKNNYKSRLWLLKIIWGLFSGIIFSCIEIAYFSKVIRIAIQSWQNGSISSFSFEAIVRFVSVLTVIMLWFCCSSRFTKNIPYTDTKDKYKSNAKSVALVTQREHKTQSTEKSQDQSYFIIILFYMLSMAVFLLNLANIPISQFAFIAMVLTYMKKDQCKGFRKVDLVIENAKAIMITIFISISVSIFIFFAEIVGISILIVGIFILYLRFFNFRKPAFLFEKRIQILQKVNQNLYNQSHFDKYKEEVADILYYLSMLYSECHQHFYGERTKNTYKLLQNKILDFNNFVILKTNEMSKMISEHPSDTNEQKEEIERFVLTIRNLAQCLSLIVLVPFKHFEKSKKNLAPEQIKLLGEIYRLFHITFSGLILSTKKSNPSTLNKQTSRINEIFFAIEKLKKTLMDEKSFKKNLVFLNFLSETKNLANYMLGFIKILDRHFATFLLR